MAFWDKLRGELVDIIEWMDPSNDTMVHRFDRYGNEIKHGAKLTVREGQVAVFIREGKIADVFNPGMYTLDTKNLPLISTLEGWRHGFESPFKAEVYFISTRRFTNLKWGTKNPIMLRDAEFGPLRLRMFGTYCMRVVEPVAFIKEIVGTDGRFTTAEIVEQLRNLIVARFSDLVAESKIPVLDMAANYDEFGQFATERLHDDFETYGLDVTNLLVENISLPPAVEEALDKRASMGVIGNLHQYTQFQAANAMEAAAKNPGGEAAGGMGLGMGFAMANQMVQGFGQQQAPPGQQAPQQVAPPGPPPVPGQTNYYVAVGGQQTGPYNAATLRTQAQQGAFTAESLVWAQGMDGWLAAGQVSELSGLFAQGPPPIPGA